MKLAQPFYRLPLRFDVERLQEEVAQFSESDWQRHPSGFGGNSAVRLISVGGEENDDFAGPMAATPHLRRSPYIQQILSHFGSVWSRSRLMRLAPGAEVPRHSDINYHWFHRVRIHIPITTAPGVSFTCDNQTVHMGMGEAWLFDNWRQHSVFNGSAKDRVHLVADTTGNAAFWRMVNASQSSGFDAISGPSPMLLPYRPNAEAKLYFEHFNVADVMPPSEIEQLTSDLLNDLKRPTSDEELRALDQFYTLAVGFCREWRTLWSLYAGHSEARPSYIALRDLILKQLEGIPSSVISASNGMTASEVFYARVLLYAVRAAEGRSEPADVDRTISSAVRSTAPTTVSSRFARPVFIIAAPRSGSTLLFETLAQARNVYTMGGEAHLLVEGLEQLRPWAPGVGSNRLTAAHASADVSTHIMSELQRNLRDRDGRPAADGAIRFLEKTPKNALRIPFFDRLFPDARFIFLWRDPKENLSSIMEAWKSGSWVVYRNLPDWDGDWSMLLPPGYVEMRGRSLEEIAAFQWARTNQLALDDLSALPQERWTSVNYADFLADPAAVTRRLCDFADFDFDDQHAAYLARPLPFSQHTLTPPSAEKWRANEESIDRVLPALQPLLERLQATRR